MLKMTQNSEQDLWKTSRKWRFNVQVKNKCNLMSMMMFRVKYGQSLGRVLLSDIHQGWLTKLLKMMRTNTSHDEDDEDNIDNRLGRKSDSKVGKMYQYLMFYYFTQFRKYNSHKKEAFKERFYFEWMDFVPKRRITILHAILSNTQCKSMTIHYFSGNITLNILSILQLVKEKI